jgi:hypothetical protein
MSRINTIMLIRSGNQLPHSMLVVEILWGARGWICKRSFRIPCWNQNGCGESGFDFHCSLSCSSSWPTTRRSSFLSSTVKFVKCKEVLIDFWRGFLMLVMN